MVSLVGDVAVAVAEDLVENAVVEVSGHSFLTGGGDRSKLDPSYGREDRI